MKAQHVTEEMLARKGVRVAELGSLIQPAVCHGDGDGAGPDDD
jgi:hypothetical protein